MSGFVIQYHRPTGALRIQEFPGADGHKEAMLCRLQLESEREDLNWEIVSLNSSSIEVLKKTHSRYFSADQVAQPA